MSGNSSPNSPNLGEIAQAFFSAAAPLQNPEIQEVLGLIENNIRDLEAKGATIGLGIQYQDAIANNPESLLQNEAFKADLKGLLEKHGSHVQPFINAMIDVKMGGSAFLKDNIVDVLTSDKPPMENPAFLEALAAEISRDGSSIGLEAVMAIHEFGHAQVADMVTEQAQAGLDGMTDGPLAGLVDQIAEKAVEINQIPGAGADGMEIDMQAVLAGLTNPDAGDTMALTEDLQRGTQMIMSALRDEHGLNIPLEKDEQGLWQYTPEAGKKIQEAVNGLDDIDNLKKAQFGVYIAAMDRLHADGKLAGQQLENTQLISLNDDITSKISPFLQQIMSFVQPFMNSINNFLKGFGLDLGENFGKTAIAGLFSALPGGIGDSLAAQLDQSLAPKGAPTQIHEVTNNRETVEFHAGVADRIRVSDESDLNGDTLVGFSKEDVLEIENLESMQGSLTVTFTDAAGNTHDVDLTKESDLQANGLLKEVDPHTNLTTFRLG